ncbi:MAG: flagellar export chaperone FliS [Lachnospiraceae bacterium]|jgi:flagellar protein FliS|nr:flagellar export chaperone FliS [Lachnospiraceae bacterium]MCI9099604.1 flagellar export chaperone FliS [Lachnospiraceae bacterium]MCI9357138.1 flagellar export chaperone FliS [Lachnospiraceae bacterium]
MIASGYQQYKNQAVSTMTQGEMLLLLFDELVKRITRAELALKDQDNVVFEQSVNRAVDIIKYLKQTLNREYAISVQLRALYDFFIYELSRVKASRRQAILDELKPLVEELRDAFRQAEKRSGR